MVLKTIIVSRAILLVGMLSFMITPDGMRGRYSPRSSVWRLSRMKMMNGRNY